MDKVSVLVPIYDVEPYIERCARSLFEQTYENLEYIFVNDSSPDKSLEILKKIVNEYPNRKDSVVIIHNSINKGVSVSRNIAIDNATGEFLSFVDSDDWLEINAIELLMKEQKHTNADVVWGKMIIHSNDGVIEMKEPHYTTKHEWLLSYCRFTGGLVMTNWRRIIRRSLFVEHNIKSAEGFNYAEDKLLMSQVAYYATSFSDVDAVVYHYNRQNNQSATAQQIYGQFNLNIFSQEYGSLNLIESFFSDKEKEYYEEAAKAKMRYLQRNLATALSCSSRKGYNIVVKCILMSDPSFWPEIGWDCWKRKLYGNYYFMKYYPIIKWKLHTLITS